MIPTWASQQPAFRGGGGAGEWTPGELGDELFAWWDAGDASTLDTTGNLVNTWSGVESRVLAKGPDSSRPSYESGRVTFTNAGMRRLSEETNFPPRRLVAQTSVTLPQAGGSETGKGFTCTGGTTAPDGTRWVMNLGIPDESSPIREPSLVHLSADFTTLLNEIPFSSIVGGPTVNAQGLTYDTVENALVFYSGGRVWFVTPGGVLIRSFTFTEFAINGMAYDPSTDQFIVCPADTNTTLRWMDKTTGALGRAIPIYGASIDQLCVDGLSLWYSGGINNSAQGGAIRKLDLVTGIVTDQWFTDSNSSEGIFVSGSEVWLLDDGWYHNTGPTNTAKKYLLDPLPGAYRGGGRTVILAGVAKLNFVAGGLTTSLVSVGQPVVTEGQGIGIFFPLGSSTALRLYVNNAFTDFSVATLDEFIYSLTFDFNTKTAELYINGVLVEARDLPLVSVAAIYPPLPITVGATREGTSITRSSNSSVANLVISSDLNSREKIEGWCAWAAGSQGLLAEGHPYKEVRP